MSQRAWDMEMRYYGGERRTGRPTRAVTQDELRDAVRKMLTEEPRTAGEITAGLELRGADVRRGAVKRHLDHLVEAGEALLERRDVTRNGFLVRDAAHYYRLPF